MSTLDHSSKLKPESNKISLLYSQFIEILSESLEDNFDVWFAWATKLLIKLLHSEAVKGEYLTNFLRIFTSLTHRKKLISPIPEGKDIHTLSAQKKANIKKILEDLICSSKYKDKEEV